MSHDLKGYAEDLWARSKAGWRPTGAEIRMRYPINEDQFGQVKRYVRGFAKEAGIGWGYYPVTGRYVLVNPRGEDSVARDVMDYQLRHWADEGRAADDTFAAFHGEGYVSDAMNSQVHILADEFDKRVTRLRQEFEQAV